MKILSKAACLFLVPVLFLCGLFFGKVGSAVCLAGDQENALIQEMKELDDLIKKVPIDQMDKKENFDPIGKKHGQTEDESENDSLNKSAQPDKTLSKSKSAGTISDTISPQDHKNLERTQKQINRIPDFPWYSQKTGKLKFIPPRPEEVKTSSPSNPLMNNNWNGLFNGATWIVLIFLLFVLVFGLVRIVFYLKRKNTVKTETPKKEDERKRQRDSLPIEAARQIGSLDQLAETAMNDGDFRSAIIYYFSWILIELDKKKFILLHKGKTNRQFLTELKGRKDLAEIYSGVMTLFEKSYYGDLPVSREEYDAVWREKDRFEEILTRTVPQRSVSAVTVLPGERTIRSILILFCILLTGLSGCRSKYWSSEYEMPLNPQSINGVSVLRDTLKSRGHEINSSSSYCSSPNDYDVIFWFDRFDMFVTGENEEKVIDCYQWLHKKENRTMILVLNGYQADYDFWNEMWSIAPPEHKQWIEEKRQRAEIAEKLSRKVFEQDKRKDGNKSNAERSVKENSSGRSSQTKAGNNDPRQFEKTSDETKGSENASADPNNIKDDSELIFEEGRQTVNEQIGGNPEDYSKWFGLRPVKELVLSSRLTGSPEWSGGLEPEFPYRFWRKVEPQKKMNVLLQAGGAPLICRSKIGKSELYVLSSPAFLLNYPLLKKDRQLVANRLIDALGESKKRILFAFGVIDFNSENQSKQEFPAVFSTKPFAILFWHLVFLTLLLMLRSFAIFGRPREIPPEERADFSKHLTAFAEMLEQSGRRDWAEKSIGLYLKQKEKERKNQ